MVPPNMVSDRRIVESILLQTLCLLHLDIVWMITDATCWIREGGSALKSGRESSALRGITVIRFLQDGRIGRVGWGMRCSRLRDLVSRLSFSIFMWRRGRDSMLIEGTRVGIRWGWGGIVRLIAWSIAASCLGGIRARGVLRMTGSRLSWEIISRGGLVYIISLWLSSGYVDLFNEPFS